jgi:hypothetical protein
VPTYRMTERQVVDYTWTVEADSEAAAYEVDDGAVPENATSKLIDSDTEAELVTTACAHVRSEVRDDSQFCCTACGEWLGR